MQKQNNLKQNIFLFYQTILVMVFHAQEGDIVYMEFAIVTLILSGRYVKVSTIIYIRVIYILELSVLRGASSSYKLVTKMT